MALKSSLTLITRRISAAVKKAATHLGLERDQYALAGSFDENSERIYLTLGVNQGVDERQLYTDVMDEIQKSLPELPQVSSHVGLVIRRVQKTDDIYLSSATAEGEEDLSEKFESAENESRRPERLLKRTVRLVAEKLTNFAKENHWGDPTYWIYYSVDPELDQVRFVFAAEAFDGQNDAGPYEAVLEYLKDVLADEPDVLDSFRLRVIGKHGADRKESGHPGPEFKEYWTLTRYHRPSRPPASPVIPGIPSHQTQGPGETASSS